MICKEKWFSTKCPASEKVREEAWRKYKELFAWLREDINETLLVSPFSTHLGLNSFIQSVAPRTKSIEITGPVKHNISIINTVKDAVKNCFWPKILVRELDQPRMEHQLDLGPKIQVLKTLLWRALNGPTDKKGKTEVVSALLRSYDLFSSLDECVSQLVRLSEEEKVIGLIWHFIKHNEINEDSLSILNCGTHGGFTTRQRYDPQKREYSGIGLWVGTMLGVRVQIHLKDKNVILVEIEKIMRLPFIVKSM